MNSTLSKVGLTRDDVQRLIGANTPLLRITPPEGTRHTYTTEQAKRAFELRREGRSHREISQIMAVPFGSVSWMVAKGERM